jgi:hypothetical protein
MRDATHAARALGVTMALVFTWWSAPASACGPPPTLREFAAHAEQIALVHAVERKQVPAEDCACSCFPQERVTFEVLETWKGSPMATFEMDLPTDAPAVMVVGRFRQDDGDEEPARPQRILSLEGLDDPGLPALRAAASRAVALAEQGDEPDPASLRAHILESLRHPTTRLDGLVEAWGVVGGPGIKGFLSDAEAADLASVVAKERPTGERLALLEPLLAGRLTPGLREIVLQRLDVAFASEEPEPVEWAEPLLLLLGWEKADDGADENTAAEEEEPAEVSGPEQERRWQEEADRYEARERQKWQDLRASWPALRRTLGG